MTTTGWIVAAAGTAVGGAAGLYAARSVKMTAMPQLVSLFNAVGGGAAALLAVHELINVVDPDLVGVQTSLTAGLDIVIGGVTFTGSLVAAGKLQGLVSGAAGGVPRVPGGQRGCWHWRSWSASAGSSAIPASLPALLLTAAAGLAFGVTMVLPIGGADMPVVISLLNAFTGTAVAMAGFVLEVDGADHRRRAGRRIRGDPDQADGRRDEPVDRRRSWSADSAPAIPPSRSAPAATPRCAPCRPTTWRSNSRTPAGW